MARRSPCSSFKANLEKNSACCSATRTEPGKRTVDQPGLQDSACAGVWEEARCISEFCTRQLKVFLSDCLGQLCMNLSAERESRCLRSLNRALNTDGEVPQLC